MVPEWRILKSCGTAGNAAPRSGLMLAASLLPLLVVALVRAVTFASSTVGSFEIDGNLNVNHVVPPLEPIDWQSSPFPAALTTFTDASESDDIFGQGSKENDQNTWSCTTGSAPPKDDIVNEISINGAPPIAGEIAFRFFPVNGVQAVPVCQLVPPVQQR